MTLLAVSNSTGVDLRGLVQDVLADPARWQPLVKHGPERHFELLLRDVEAEVWVVSWSPGHDTGFHDHDDSAAAIVVAEGEIRELRLAVGRANVDWLSRMGQYEVSPNGTLQRHASRADKELKPVPE